MNRPAVSITEKVNFPVNVPEHEFIERLYGVFNKKSLCVILDSSLNNDGLGSYSIIASDPFLIFKSTGYEIEISGKRHSEKIRSNPFVILKSLLSVYKATRGIPCLEIPFKSGCAGYFSYDLCNQIEKLPAKKDDKSGLPDIYLGFYNNSIIIDHLNAWIYINVSSEGICSNSRLVTARLNKKLEELKSLIMQCCIPSGADYKNGRKSSEFENSNVCRMTSNYSKEEYCRMVEKAKKYIYDGDIYQVNLSQKFSAIIDKEPFDLYLRLRKINAAPFSAYLDFGTLKLLSSSPERFIRLTGDIIETRPIKGTRPRGKTPEEDMRYIDELLNSAKDRAELTMIVDLERNDLGKVCKTGSVAVEKLICIESYSTVHHLVSTIEGTIRDGIDAVDCIKATFPGGSITGAPKIRSMEIINELESTNRGVYTGSIGYIDFCGNMDLNIAIRTIIVDGNEVCFNVGGGIVWDSVPEDEYAETLSKGEALLKVLSGG